MQQRDWHHVTDLTRRTIFDSLRVGKHCWAGKLDDVDFLSRLFDLSSLPSRDSRHKDMAGDIWRHRVINPEDWDDDWVFSDDRLDLLGRPRQRYSFGSCARWSTPSCGMGRRWTTWWPPSTDTSRRTVIGWQWWTPCQVAGFSGRSWLWRVLMAALDDARRIANTLSSGHVTAQITRMRGEHRPRRAAGDRQRQGVCGNPSARGHP